MDVEVCQLVIRSVKYPLCLLLRLGVQSLAALQRPAHIGPTNITIIYCFFHLQAGTC